MEYLAAVWRSVAMSSAKRLERETSAAPATSGFGATAIGIVLTLSAVVALHAAGTSANLAANTSDTHALPLVRFLVAVVMWSGALISLAFVVPARRRNAVSLLYWATLLAGVTAMLVAYAVMDSAARTSGATASQVFAIGLFGTIGGAVLFACAMIALAVHYRDR